MELLGFLFTMLILSLAAARWGVDSVDAIDHSEWEYRRAWYGR